MSNKKELRNQRTRLALFHENFSIIYDAEDIEKGENPRSGWDIRLMHKNTITTKKLEEFTHIIKTFAQIIETLDGNGE